MSPNTKDTKNSSSCLRARILEEATRLFATQGFAGTSIREVVEASGCTKPALYYYFSNKEALFSEVVAYHTECVTKLITKWMGGDGTVRAVIHEGVDAMIAYAQSAPLAMQLMHRVEFEQDPDAPPVDLLDMRATHLRHATKLIEHGIELGEVRPEVSADEGALLLVGAMHLQFQYSIATGHWDPERMHRTVDLVFEGIGNHE